jgi:hypothetical protein
MSKPLDRHDYYTMASEELTRRLRAVRDRMARADTAEAALADAFTEQELCHVIYDRAPGP